MVVTVTVFRFIQCCEYYSIFRDRTDTQASLCFVQLSLHWEFLKAVLKGQQGSHLTGNINPTGKIKRQLIPNRYGVALRFLALLYWKLKYKGLVECFSTLREKPQFPRSLVMLWFTLPPCPWERVK